MYSKKPTRSCSTYFGRLVLSSNIKYPIYCTQIIITSWLLQLGSCCAAVQRSYHRLVPVFLFSPVHHFHEELHQLLLVLQVVVSSQVLVCLTLCEVLLVLPDPPRPTCQAHPVYVLFKHHAMVIDMP